MALLIKNLHKFFNRAHIRPWVHLAGEKYYKNNKLPCHIKRGSSGDGKTILKLVGKNSKVLRVYASMPVTEWSFMSSFGMTASKDSRRSSLYCIVHAYIEFEIKDKIEK